MSMVKNEQMRSVGHFLRIFPRASSEFMPPTPPMSQKPAKIAPQRTIDPRAIDISSIQGRFAWEKITISDTYMPVIFRGTTKYFSVTMLRNLLLDYPEDVITKASYYNYHKRIPLYKATTNETELLNRINSHHAHWTYGQKPFLGTTELVTAMDFLPFLEHLHSHSQSQARSTSTDLLRPILTQPLLTTQGPTHSASKPSPITPRVVSASFPRTIAQIQPSLPSQSSLINNSSSRRPATSTRANPTMVRKFKKTSQPKTGPKHIPTDLSTQPSSLSAPISQTPAEIPSINTVITTNTGANKPSTSSIASIVPIPETTVLTMMINSSICDTTTAPLPNVYVPQLATATSESQSSIISDSVVVASVLPPTSTNTEVAPKTSNLHTGWLQINKLYTPFISTSVIDRHLYRIPVSLLTFYDLLRVPCAEAIANESRDSSVMFDQKPMTPQENQLINELCAKQSIKPFSAETNLIDLTTFYHFCAPGILFIKELSSHDPKGAICKDWPSIVQLNGGICRLRNISTLHEQTVPFIGNNLLKNFILSAQCLATATLTVPTVLEAEFLQLILFFTNMDVNLRNAKLIDIESVKREYNVDLILLFNDKFPLNVLNYQQQVNRPVLTPSSMLSSSSSAPTNTIAESTPPPSPPSPVNNPTSSSSNNPVPTSSASSPFPLTGLTNTSSRYQKTILFHGHLLTAYICSNLEANTQRECVSIRELCRILYPVAANIDKIETKMLRLLRSKHVNRFRPQNQQYVGITRLIDVKDAETHWDYLKTSMYSPVTIASNEVIAPRVSTPAAQASTSDLVKDKPEQMKQFAKVPEISIDVDSAIKRALDEMFEEALEEKKRPRLSENDGCTSSTMELSQFMETKIDGVDCLEDIREAKIIEAELPRVIQLESDDEQQQKKKESTKVKPKRIRVNKNRTSSVEKKRLEKKPVEVIEKPSTMPKKRIFLARTRRKMARKHLKPCARLNQKSTAAWAKKYHIEECWIHLDLYDPLKNINRN